MNNVYSYTEQFLLIPGAANLQFFDLVNIRRQMLFKSILWHLGVVQSPGSLIPLSQVNFLTYQVNINAGGVSRLSRSFSNFNIPGVVLYNGNGFTLTIPGQYFFDSFFIDQNVNFQVAIQNNHAANSYQITQTIVVETEEGYLKRKK